MTETKVFADFKEFAKREDKTTNGVSPKFAKQNPGFAVDNETNKGCWDCWDCTYCWDCRDCRGCSQCSQCRGCTYCTDCTYCVGCVGCADCTYCRGCVRSVRSVFCTDERERLQTNDRN